MSDSHTATSAPPLRSPAAIFWDGHANVYERVFEAMTWLWGRDAFILANLPRALQQHDDAQQEGKEMTFLDVACGPGSLSITALEKGFTVTATDLSKVMVELVQKKAAASALKNKLSASVLDGQTLEGLQDESFDVVASNFGAFAFPDRMLTWKNARRVLKKNGFLLATSWDVNSVNMKFRQYVVDNVKDIVPKTEEEKATAPNVLQPALNRTLTASTFKEELLESEFEHVDVYTVTHDFVISSGKDFVAGVLDNPMFADIIASKDSNEVKWALLDAANSVSTNNNSNSEVRSSTAPRGPVDSSPSWRRPVIFPCTGHIAVARK